MDLRKHSKTGDALQKSSEKKRRNSTFLNKVLKDIKSNKQQNPQKELPKPAPQFEEPLELPLRTLDDIEPKLAISVEVRD